MLYGSGTHESYAHKGREMPQERIKESLLYRMEGTLYAHSAVQDIPIAAWNVGRNMSRWL